MKLISSILVVVASSSAFAGNLSASQCTSNGNPFVKDTCSRVSIQSTQCRAIMSSGTLTVRATQLAAHGLSDTLESNLPAPYNYSNTFSRHQLNFGGLVRGMAIVTMGKKGTPRLGQVEIYVNDDSSGTTYTRYICR